MTTTMRPFLAWIATWCAACGSSAPPPAAPAPAAAPVIPVAPTPAQEPAAEPTPEPAPAATADAEPEDPKVQLLAAETAAYDRARPVLEKYCASCHTKGGKSASAKKLHHFDMTTYPFGGHHAGEMAATMRKVLGIGGGKPTMPRGKPGVVHGEELALIAAWADAFEAAHDAGAHEGVPGHDHHKGGHGHHH